MLGKKLVTFSFAFAFLVLIELLAGTVLLEVEWLQYIAKPAIVVSLLILFVAQRSSAPKRTRSIIIVALLFCLIGDVLLLFQELSPLFFLLGLIAFLLGHVGFIAAFVREKGSAGAPLKTAKFVRFLALTIAYAAGLYFLLYDGLAEMKLPVLVYEIVILGMVISALKRFGKTSSFSFWLVFVGALFFMSSDTLLAINKFHTPLPLSHVWIMGTYAIAQFLIVVGILHASEEQAP
jgi:uncharacterized membrane protein YhhN